MIVFDDTHFPVLLARGDSLDERELDKQLSTLVNLARRAQLESTSCVLITIEGGSLDSRLRKHLAEAVKNADPVLHERLVLSIVLVSDAIKRGALTALLWLIGPSPKTEALKDIPHALARARAELKARGITFPSDCSESYVAAFARRVV